MLRAFCSGIILLLVSGCASYGVVENAPGPVAPGEQDYSVRAFMENWRTSENALMLAFSGGGTRADASPPLNCYLSQTTICSDYV